MTSWQTITQMEEDRVYQFHVQLLLLMGQDFLAKTMRKNVSRTQHQSLKEWKCNAKNNARHSIKLWPFAQHFIQVEEFPVFVAPLLLHIPYLAASLFTSAISHIALGLAKRLSNLVISSIAPLSSRRRRRNLQTETEWRVVVSLFPSSSITIILVPC